MWSCLCCECKADIEILMPNHYVTCVALPLNCILHCVFHVLVCIIATTKTTTSAAAAAAAAATSLALS